MSPSATLWLTDVFLIVFGQQWSSIAQRNNTHTILATHSLLLIIKNYRMSLDLSFKHDFTVSSTVSYKIIQ